MKKIISAVSTTLVALSFTAIVFAADSAKPVAPAGSSSESLYDKNKAVEAATAKASTEEKKAFAKAVAKADAKEAKAKKKAAAKEAKAKAKADAKAAKDAIAPAAK